MRLLNFSPLVVMSLLLFYACSKNSSGPPPDPCAGVTIVVNAAVVNTTGPGKGDGTITASATGGSSFTFSINGGAFQSSGTFSSLTAGSYTITARSSAGCTGTGNFTIADGDPCAGKTITVSATPTASEPCSGTGTVSISAAGSTGFTYKLNAGGTFQSAPNFSNVAAGTYTVFARDNAGCEKTATVTVGALPAGSLFTSVKSLLQAKCGTCHISATNGGANFGTDCNIVTLKDRIKVRAVDTGDMPQGGPQLTTAEKKIITDWITAGGRVSN